MDKCRHYTKSEFVELSEKERFGILLVGELATLITAQKCGECSLVLAQVRADTGLATEDQGTTTHKYHPLLGDPGL